MSEEMISVRKADVDVLVAAVTSWAHSDAPSHVHEAFSRMLAAFDEAHDDEYRPAEAGKAQADAETPKVIVVTEVDNSDRPPVVRRYAASQWDDSDPSRLRILQRGTPVASYQPGAWLAVRLDGAEASDGVVLALGIAYRALNEIAARSNDGGATPFGRPEIGALAADAINAMWNETDL